MNIVGRYSFNRGEQIVTSNYPDLLAEIEYFVTAVDSTKLRTKKSREKTKKGRLLYSPRKLNSEFKKVFSKRGWRSERVDCEYSMSHYLDPAVVRKPVKNAYREMDFIKNRLGVEIQFGKYAFMVYNVCAKMTIFHNLKHIDAGVEIVPVKAFAEEMSSGVSYFEQFVWDLENRGVADIDIPVLILGIDA